MIPENAILGSTSPAWLRQPKDAARLIWVSCLLKIGDSYQRQVPGMNLSGLFLELAPSELLQGASILPAAFSPKTLPNCQSR